MANTFRSAKHWLDNQLKSFGSWKHPCCTPFCSSVISLWMTRKNNCNEGTTNPQLQQYKEALWASFLSSWCTIQHWKVYAFCGWSDAAMLSCYLYMDSWLLGKYSLALHKAAPLPSVQSTEIVVRRTEFLVVLIEWQSAISLEHDTRDSWRWDGEMRVVTISGRSSGWNLRCCTLE